MKAMHELLIPALLVAASTGWCQPIITTQPQNQTNIAGTTATFTVEATNSSPIFYQWRFHVGLFNEANLTDQTNTTLVLTNVQTGNAGPYAVVVSNMDGSATSVVATLTVIVPPTVTRQPTNQSVSLGASATFSVSASGTAPLRFQWRLNETELSGKTNTSLVVTNLQVTNAGDYTVVITHLGGSVTSQVAHLDVDPTFTKITTGAPVSELGGYGCAWGDYDNDGFIDLIVTVPFNSAQNSPNKNTLFRNNRDGTFTQITNSIVVSEARDWRGCAWADYDNDGNLDLFVTSTDDFGFAAQNELFRNNGDGTFTKMTSSDVGAIVSLAAGGSEHCIW